MKHQPFFCVLLVLLTTSQISFAQTQTVKQSSHFNMRGAYLMFRQTLNAGKGDSLLAVHQLKLFTDKYVMYAHRRELDSLADFSIGMYSVENGKVIEKVFYDNYGPQNITRELHVVWDNDGYTQVANITGGEQNSGAVLTEDYKKFGREIKSPLDGAWQQVRTVSVSKDGQTTTNEQPVQFKVFEEGNFIWANVIKDSASGQYIARYGFGTFDMKDPIRAAEVNLSSTYSATLEGRPVFLDLKFSGKNKYEQTITYPDGSKYTEVYKRLN